MILYLLSGLCIFISCAFGMKGSPGGSGTSITGVYQDVKQATQDFQGSSHQANQLRSNLAMLAGKLNSLGGTTPGQLGDKTKAEQVAATVAMIVQTLIGSSVLSAITATESLKGSISSNAYLQALFIQQGGNVSVWDSSIYPHVLTTFIRLQASYAAALLNYISQHINRLTPDEINGLNSSVQSMQNQLNSLV